MKTHPHLRLVVDNEAGAHISRCNESSAIAAEPLGSAVRSCSMSDTAPGDSPMRDPIAASVKPFRRKSDTLDAHVVMSPILRHPVDKLQRHSVNGVRDTLDMPQKQSDAPSFSTIGERIVYWRERRGLTRPKLSKLAKVPYSTLAGIETNQQDSSTKITQIAAVLRVNPHYLATGQGNPEEQATARQAADEWPLPFARDDLMELDPIELELAGLKFQRIIDEIRSKRPKQRTRKVS